LIDEVEGSGVLIDEVEGEGVGEGVALLANDD
jgi:hypothetical protein